MDRTHDVETAPPETQPAPPTPQAPGRQPTEPQPASGQAPPAGAGGGRVSAQRFHTAMARLLGAMARFRESAIAAIDPYKVAYDTYVAILTRRAQRAQLAQQIAFQILFVGVGGAFGGVLQNVIRTYGPGAVNARRIAATPLTKDSNVVVGVGTGAGDILKDFVRRFNAPGAGAIGTSQPVDPEGMTRLVDRSLSAANAEALSVMEQLSAATERDEQQETDPLALVDELAAQMRISPQIPPPDRYLREFFERNEFVRSWRAQVSAAPSESEIDRLWAHDRLFLRDIEEACPGLVRAHYQRERDRVRARRMGPEMPRR